LTVFASMSERFGRGGSHAGPPVSDLRANPFAYDDRLGQPLPCGGQRQSAVFNPFGGYQLIRKAFDGIACTLQDEDLKAVVMVKVHMDARQDNVMLIMLYLHQPLGQVRDVVVINQ